jgi:hypothetical protein
MIKKENLAFIGYLILAGCTGKDHSIEQFSWLSGDWEGRWDEDTEIYESWNTVKDQAMNGIGYVMSGPDTLFSEKMKLEMKDGDIFYIVRTKQNAEPVSFRLEQYEHNEALFTNPEHDFPQRIIYRLEADSSLYARVEGKEEGKERKEEFRFKRKR